MKRLFLVYNPRSSRFIDVEKEVISRLRNLKGYTICKYKVKPTNVDDNIAIFAKLLKDGDFVLAAGGDATGIIASNGILKSKKDATLAVLPYGNFNDLARTLGTMKYDDVFDGDSIRTNTASQKTHSKNHSNITKGKAQQELYGSLYPLEIYVDGRFFRYATCYVTIGMTAEACELFDEPKFRKEMQKGHKSSWRSYLALVKWYFKNRHKKQYIPEFKLNGVLKHSKTSDYAAVNGRSMCRVMKGGNDYKIPRTFRSMTDRLTNFWRLFKLMVAAILVRTPGTETTGDLLEFVDPATVELQAEGEYYTFKDIKTIEIRKSNKCLKVIEI